MSSSPKISVIGLGIVGLTVAAAFAESYAVLGFDIDSKRVAALKKGHDKNNQISRAALKNTKINFTTQLNQLRKANFHIIAVPTPIDSNNLPNLSILLSATRMLASVLKKGDIVVYESTVYPGVTEEECIPLLEKYSGLRCGKDFGVGYSPERINPDDPNHTLQTIPKVISAINSETLQSIAEVYNQIITVGTHPVSSIKIAEAVKLVENTQRDVNISLMNEIAIILHCLGLESEEVINAAKTKWNFIPAQPGLVGGHCIGVNSYYLTYKAKKVGYHPDLILAGRRINSFMPKFIADSTIKALIHLGVAINKARIAIFGVTYKENSVDINDSRVLDLIKELKSYGAEIIVHDPIADKSHAKKYNLSLKSLSGLKKLDAIIIAVAHQPFFTLSVEKFTSILKPKGLIVDVKNVLNPNEFVKSKITLWRL